jgi:hypothetical protein
MYCIGAGSDAVAALLVDDRVQRDGRLAGLAVADDQLALAAADRDHAVDGLDAGLQRLLHRLAVHNAGRDALDGVVRGGLDRPAVVDRLAERVHHAPDHRLAHRHRHDAARPPDFVAFLDFRVVAQQHRAHLVFFQVQRDPRHAVRKLDQLARHDLLQAVNARDAVADRDHRTDFGYFDRFLVILNLFAEDPLDFVRSNLSHIYLCCRAGYPAPAASSVSFPLPRACA